MVNGSNVVNLRQVPERNKGIFQVNPYVLEVNPLANVSHDAKMKNLWRSLISVPFQASDTRRIVTHCAAFRIARACLEGRR
jgi:hypothetical protein